MNRLTLLIISLLALFLSSSCESLSAAGPSRPNIVFIITDDQGYGDLGCHGNPVIQTPHIDALAAESSQLSDYHVAPTFTEGTFQISLRRWPVEADQPITAALPSGDDVPGASKAYRAHPGKAIPAVTATLRIDDQDLETKTVATGDKSISFTTTLTAGSHRLAPVFTDTDGHEVGAYYVVVTKP